MTRFQTGIVREDGVQQLFGIFQVHITGLCGNVSHTLYSFPTVGLELGLNSLFNCGAIVNQLSFGRSPTSGAIVNS